MSEALLNLQSRIEAIEALIGAHSEQPLANAEITTEELATTDSSLTSRTRRLAVNLAGLGATQATALAELGLLAPNAATGPTLDRHSKAEFVLASAQMVEKAALDFDQIEQTKQYISSKDIQSMPVAIRKLDPLKTIHIEQMGKCDAQTKELEAMLDVYNDYVHSLTTQFLEWDRLLANVEEQLQISK